MTDDRTYGEQVWERAWKNPIQNKQESEETKMTEQQVKVEDLVAIESGVSIDVTQYEGMRAKIAGFEILDTKIDYDEKGQLVPGLGRPSKALKVFTEPLDEIDDKKGGKFQVRATELFNLKKDAAGKWGWATHDQAKIQKLFRKLKVSSPQEAVGKFVIVTARTGKNGKTSYLRIVYD